MSLSRKHFKALATILSENNCDVNLLKDIMLFCKSHNSNFDSVRFVEASGFTVNQSGNFVRHPDLLTVNNGVELSQAWVNKN